MGNEFDQIGWFILFYLFPALTGFFLSKEFKVRTSIILALALFLFIIGYVSYIVLCYSSIFIIIGVMMAKYMEEKDE